MSRHTLPWFAELRPEEPDTAVPRSGLARALAKHIADAFGNRPTRLKVLRVLTRFLEVYNEEIHREGETPDEVLRKLARDVLRYWQPLERTVRDGDALIERVLRRVSSAEAESLADTTLPECVLYLRMVVAVGVVAGEVPEDEHILLDRYAIGLGLCWELAQQELTLAGWCGALALAGVLPAEGLTELPTDAFAQAAAMARKALDELSLKRTEVLAALVASPPIEAVRVSRRHSAYAPFRPARPLPRPPVAALGSFADRWRPALQHAMSALTATQSPAFAHAAAYLQDLGGKRFRGLLTIAAAAACDADPTRALQGAAAVEWMHQASLVIDDLIDRAETRRGAPALHQLTTPLFTVATAAFLLWRCREATKSLPEGVARALLRAALALLRGQCLELALAPSKASTIDGYYRVAEAKTAQLFACAAALGALCVGDDETAARTRVLAEYGRQVGLAFQIVDDVLDYVGDDDALGKRTGTDFKNGRPTLPLILLEREASLPEDADFITSRAAVTSSGVADLCLARARRHIEAAQGIIAQLPGAVGRTALEWFAVAAVERHA